MCICARVPILAVFACCAVAQGSMVDLGGGGAGMINGARFETTDFRPAGTGVIDSFVRIQHNGSEQGYNTSGRPLPFDENNSPNFTRDLQLNQLPTMTVDGTGYYEFLLDINQRANSGDSMLSLDGVQLYTSPTGSQTTTNVPSLGSLRYDMDAGADNWVRLDYNLLRGGSGVGDMRLLVPVADFAGAAPGDFVYLYSRFGLHDASNAGFEEWAVRGAVPAPGAWALLSAAGLMAVLRRR